MFKVFITFCLFSSVLFSERPSVKIVSTFCETGGYEEILQSGGIDARCLPSNLSEYGSALEKNRTRWGRLVRKLHLDFPRKVDLSDDILKIVFLNTSVRYSRNLSLQKLPKEKLVLFMWEPPNALPKMYSKNLHAKFGRVYTWDDSLVDNKKYFKFFYPVLNPMIEDVVPFDQKKLCTMISGAIRPKYPSSLYGERIKAIEYFEQAGEEGFEFYGRRWDPLRYKSYRGPVADKTETLKNYRFSICYENTKDLSGYITEKIFDCFAAGNVPVYWGAGNVADYIPKECFIDRRDFATMEELHAFLKNMGPEEYEGYIKQIRTFLNSKEAELFSKQNFNRIFCEAVSN